MIGFALPALLLAAAAPAEAASVEVKARKVCRPAAAPLGSRIKRARVCRTAAEWDEQDAARRAADIPVKPSQPEPWERTRPQ
jgi:hypothetical protein